MCAVFIYIYRNITRAHINVHVRSEGRRSGLRANTGFAREYLRREWERGDPATRSSVPPLLIKFLVSINRGILISINWRFNGRMRRVRYSSCTYKTVINVGTPLRGDFFTHPPPAVSFK